MTKKDCLYLGFQKGSGRTTRMLREAIRLCTEDRTYVSIFVNDKSHAVRLHDQLFEIYRRDDSIFFPSLLSIEHQILPFGNSGPSIRFIETRGRNLIDMWDRFSEIGNEKNVFLADHETIEVQLKKPLDMLHRWDYPIKTLEACDMAEWQAARAARAKAQEPRKVEKFGLEYINFKPGEGFRPVGSDKYAKFYSSLNELLAGAATPQEHLKTINQIRKENGLPDLPEPEIKPLILTPKSYQSKIRISSDFLSPNEIRKLKAPYFCRVWFAICLLIRTILGKKS